MKLVDFLILVLVTHADTLQRLSALLEEENLLELMEQAGENPKYAVQTFELNPVWFSSPILSVVGDSSSPYTRLKGSIQELRLSPVLEFHLWAYPFYRMFIESALDLDSTIKGGDAGTALVEAATSQAELWIRTLPIKPEMGLVAERVSHIPWLKFRTEILKRVGKRPMGPVY